MNRVHELPGLTWHEDGYAALGEPLLNYLRQLDATWRSWAREMEASEHRFPSFISLEQLQPIGYLRSFPQLATFAANLDEEGAEAHAGRPHPSIVRIEAQAKHWAPVSHLLTPAACYHFYPRLAGHSLNRPRFLTTRCTCHRRERAYAPLQRQWSFEMRELVCLGDPETVASFIDDCESRIAGLVKRLKLRVRWEQASDPFFRPSDNPLALAQQVEPVKQELVLDDGLAIASINRHRAYFGEAYSITMRGRGVHSACVAFGLERWLFAMCGRHGPDPVVWPAPGHGGD